MAAHFEDLGLPPGAIGAYLELLTDKDAAGPHLLDELDHGVVAVLEEAGFLVSSAEGGHTAVDPRVALNRLIDSHDAELRARMARVAHMRRVTSSLAKEVDRHRRVVNPSLEVVEGRANIGDRISQLLLNAREEALVMLAWAPPTEALPASRVHDAALLERGVAIRMLALQAHYRASTEYSAHLREIADLGADVRLATVLPTRLVTIDREVAIVPNDPASPEEAATVVHQQTIVALTVDAFEFLWHDAQPIAPRSTNDAWEPDALALKVLDLLADGAKDESVARMVGMSVRSVRRLISRVSEETGTESRFALGAIAVSNGWVTRRPPN